MVLASAEDVAATLGVDVSTGLSAARAAELLGVNGPNALPEEQPRPGWQRFLDQYRSYMQIILVVAAVVSLIIEEWSTGVLLVLLTMFNAIVGLRQEGKAESAMNALRSMMKATARVRRDGVEAEIPAEDARRRRRRPARGRGSGSRGRPHRRRELLSGRTSRP